MDIEDRVCSLELSKRIKELGVKQNGYFTWHRMHHTAKYEVIVTTLTDVPQSSRGWAASDFSAFTSDELGEMLPGDDTVASRKLNSSWRSILYDFRGLNHYFTQDKTEANARAKMLIYLLEKGLVKP